MLGPEQSAAARRTIDRIAAAVALLLNVPRVLIGIFDGNRHSVVGSYAAHELRGGDEDLIRLCRDVAIGKRPIVMQDARRRLPSNTEIVSCAGVPLPMLDGTILGALNVFEVTRRTWQDRDLLVLRSFAEAVAAIFDERVRLEAQLAAANTAHTDSAMERERVADSDHRRTLELERTVVHDELTGLLNRRGFFAVGTAQLETMRRRGLGGLLLYIDLDGLKTVNDRYGHAAGDELLRAAGGVLRSSFREADTIARLGGDELVVMSVDAPASKHAAMSGRLVAELERCNQLRDPALSLTWSVGVVAIDPTATTELDELVRDADRRMYEAKRARRRV